MKFREHRGGYAESVQTVVEIEPTRAALSTHLATVLHEHKDFVSERVLTVRPYPEPPRLDGPLEIDERNGWTTYIVILNGYGVVGYTDGPLAD